MASVVSPKNLYRVITHKRDSWWDLNQRLFSYPTLPPLLVNFFHGDIDSSRGQSFTVISSFEFDSVAIATSLCLLCKRC